MFILFKTTREKLLRLLLVTNILYSSLKYIKNTKYKNTTKKTFFHSILYNLYRVNIECIYRIDARLFIILIVFFIQSLLIASI